MKRICLILVMLLLLSYTANAGDIPYSLHPDRVSALIIGKVAEKNQDSYTVEVIQALFGDVGERVVVPKFLYLDNKTPKVNDTLIIPLNDDNTIWLGWAFKTKGTNYKTLKLDIAAKHGMNKWYEELINKGHYNGLAKTTDNPAESVETETLSEQSSEPLPYSTKLIVTLIILAFVLLLILIFWRNKNA